VAVSNFATQASREKRGRNGVPYFRSRKVASEPLAGAGVFLSVDNTLPPTRWLGISGMIALAIMVGVGVASFSSAVATDSMIGALAMAALWAGSSLLFERADFRLLPSSAYPGTNAEGATAADLLLFETL
jgi:hypothetical protein